MLAWASGCGLFQPHKAPTPSAAPQPAPPPAVPAKLPPTTIRIERVRSAPTIASKPPQHHLNPPPTPVVAPVVTLENSQDTKANAQRLLDQVTVKMTHVNRAELVESTASTYQQANELINAAQRAMAARDYLAASSLAQKASALTSELPSQK
jgi:hypothetical protein